MLECTYTNLYGITYYTPRPYGTAYCSEAANLYSMLLYKTTQDYIKGRENNATKRCLVNMRYMRLLPAKHRLTA